MLNWKRVNLLDSAGMLKTFQDFQPTHVVHLAARTDVSGKTLVDYSMNTVRVLGEPPFTLQDGIKETAGWLLEMGFVKKIYV